MSEIATVQEIYALAAPMQIGAVAATTLAINLSAVVFDAPVAFVVGDDIDFRVFVALEIGPVQLDCRGLVLSCSAREEGRFEVEATIESFEIAAGISVRNA